jgi:type II secretion system protein I
VALLEALVALLILGIAIVGIVASASGALRGQASAREHRDAMAIADAQLSLLATASAEALESYGEETSGETTIGGQSYSWLSRVRSENDSAGMWSLRVTVRWDAGTVSLGTALWRPPRRLPGSWPR